MLDIIEHVWGAGRRRDFDLLWEWKHGRDRSASGDEGRLSHVVEGAAGIAGYCGAIPIRAKIGNSMIDGAVCLDTFTDPASRGAGVRLMKRQLEAGRFLIGAATKRAQELWGRLIGRPSIVVKEARKMACLLDPGPILQRRGAPGAVIATVRGLNRLTRRLLFRDGAGPAAPGARLEEVEAFPAEIDALCSEFMGRFANILARDRDYLEWRFVRCPFPYRRVLLRGADGLRGYAVYRETDLNGRRVVLLVEIAAGGRTAENYRALLRHVERQALAAGACEIETLDPGCPVLLREMRRRGYFRKRERLPIIAHAPGEIGKDVYDPGRWYLGLGDCDFEFIFFNQGVGSLAERGTTPRQRAS